MSNFLIAKVWRIGGGGGSSGDVFITTARGGLFIDTPIQIPGTLRRGVSGGGQDWNKGCMAVKWIADEGTNTVPTLFVAISRYGVYKSLDEGASWSQEFSYGGDLSNFVIVTGIDSKKYLCLTQANTVVRSYDGTSWRSDTLDFNSNDQCFAHEGIMFMQSLNTTNAQTFDPVTRSSCHLGGMPSDTSNYVGVWFTLGKRMFYAMPRVPGLGLAEWAYGAWVLLSSSYISYINTSTGGIEQWPTTLKLADDSVLIFGPGNNGSGNGLECAHVKLDGTTTGQLPTVNRVTTAVVPSALYDGSAIGDSDQYKLGAFVDNSDPDNVRRYLFFAPDNDAVVAFSLFEVFDELTQMELLGTTNYDNDWSIPNIPHGGGEYIWSPGEISIQIEDYEQDPNGLKIYFRCSGDPGLEDKTVSFRYINSYGVPNQVCTLVANSASGTTAVDVSGNTVVNVNADENILYEVVWDFITDGVPDGTYLHHQAFIARP